MKKKRKGNETRTNLVITRTPTAPEREEGEGRLNFLFLPPSLYGLRSKLRAEKRKGGKGKKGGAVC